MTLRSIPKKTTTKWTYSKWRKATPGIVPIRIPTASGQVHSFRSAHQHEHRDNLSPKDYKLTLLSRNGTLNKYIVNDFTVLPDAVRYYVIVQLARLWNDDVDGKPSGNEAKTVPYPIGKQFTACTIDGNVTYTEKHTDVVTILPEQRFDGFLRYSDGFTLYATACDSWFVAFTCDYKIDKFMDADVEYTTRFVSQTIVFKSTYTWNRIEKRKISL